MKKDIKKVGSGEQHEEEELADAEIREYMRRCRQKDEEDDRQ